MPEVTIDLTQLAPFAPLLRAMPDEVTAVLSRALYTGANIVMSQSLRVVPFQYGILAGSGFVTQPETEDGLITVTLGYGGAASEYALYVHEIPTPDGSGPYTDLQQWTPGERRARHDAPTGWKFLEGPMLEYQDQLQEDLTEALVDAMIEALSK